VGVRIVSATNRDLLEEVRSGRFREDLYYRLKVVPLRLPPLRERPGDIPLLAEHFMRLFNGQFGRSFRGFTAAARSALLRYPWPGNIREMRNVLERTVLLGRGEWIDERDLHLQPVPSGPDGDLVERLADGLAGRFDPEGFPLEELTDEIERQIILQASEKANWNQTCTARMLRMNRDRLRYRMKHHGLAREGVRAV
jgi:DNA-binding NtrC family response regulator